MAGEALRTSDAGPAETAKGRRFEAVVSSGDMRPESHDGVEFSHRWTAEGVVVESAFTGAHLLHRSGAGCVLNGVHREAENLGVAVDGVRISAWGDFDRETFQSTGVEYRVEINSNAARSDIDRLVQSVDDVAEIPKCLRAEAEVRRG